MKFEVGYKSITDNGIHFQIIKNLSRWYCVVKIWKEKNEAHKIVSYSQIVEKNILFEEDFFK